MKMLTSWLLFGLLCLMQPQGARAGEPRQAVVRLVAYKVVLVPDARGGSKETLRPLESLSPGDTVEYEASYVNDTAQAVHEVELSVPVPAGGLELIAAPRAPAADSASLDGARFAALPLTRMERTPDGRSVTRNVPLAEYRVLRWDLGDVPAGTTRTVRARMQLPATTRLAN